MRQITNGVWARRVAGAAALVLALSGAGAPARAQIFMSPAQEKQTGSTEHPKIIAQYGGVYDARGLGAYVSKLGLKLAAKSEDPSIGYTVTLLNSPIVNAFALPGGYVYVTRGLLALANSEAELGGVLGHEIGHVTSHHTAKRYDRAVGTAILGTLLGAVTGSQILGNLANAGGQAYLASFSRSQEYQADLLGVKTLSRTGYDPYAQSDFLATLGREEKLTSKLSGAEQSRFQFFATHPNTTDRVQKAADEARKEGATPNARPRYRDDYLSHIDGMLYGDDPEQGFIRGRTFAHPALRFRFTAPEGYSLQNSTEQVAAQAEDGSTILLDGRNVVGGTTPERYLTQGFAQELNVTPEAVESFEVHGLHAASGTARAQIQQGEVDVRLVAIQFSATQMYRFVLVTAPDKTAARAPAMQQCVMSFERLSVQDAAALKPLRVRVVMAKSGDSVQSIAARMGFSDFREERFRVLNALDGGQGVVSGTRYKIIE